MANQSTIAIELIVNDKGSVTIKQFGTDAEKSLKGVETSAGNTASASDKLKESWTDLAAKGAAAWLAVTQAMAYMDQGAKALQVESSFKIMAESSGAMADAMIANMKAATRETIDDSDLMQKAIKLLTLGYDPTEIERFSGVVITASQIAGTTAVEAYDRLSDAIANRMPKALVAMGAVTKDQMKVVTDALASGATQSDLLELALSNLELKQKMLQGTSDEASVSMQKFHAIIGETKETIGKGLIIVADALFRSFQFLAAQVLNVVAAYYQFKTVSLELIGADKLAAESRADWNAALSASNDLMGKAGKGILDNSAAGQKATAQEIADAKVKVEYAKARLKFIADEGMSEAEQAAISKKAAEDAIKASDEIAKRGEKNASDLADSWKTYYDDKEKQEKEDNKAVLEFQEAEKKALEKTMESWRKSGEEAVGWMEKEITTGVNLSKETIARNDEIRAVTEKLYKDVSGPGGWDETQYNTLKGSIDQHKKDWDALGIDKNLTDTWYYGELDKLDVKRALASTSFFEGVRAGFTDTGMMTTWGKTGFGVVEQFRKDANTELSDNFFNIMKGNFDQVGIDWGKLTGGMLKSLSENLAKMVTEAAANAISMLFKATVSGDWTQILGIINKGWDLWNSFGSGGGAEQLSGPGMARGGMVPGYAAGGDSRSNDTVRAWLSPGEYVVPRSAINADSLELLEYLRKSGGQARGYADGGLVKPYSADGYVLPTGSVQESVYLSSYGWGPRGDQSYGWIDRPGTATLPPPYLTEWGQVIPYRSEPVTVGGQDYNSMDLRPGDGYIGHSGPTYAEMPWLFKLADAVISYICPPWAVASGAMKLIGGVATQDYGIAVAGGIQAVGGAYGTYNGSGLASDVGWQGLYDAAKAYGWEYVKKYVVGEALGYLSNAFNGGASGSASLSFTGASGDLSGLAALMGQIAPQESSFSFPLVSARNGLDYVPRDNFRINAHEGEAVLNKKDAKEWRGGSARGGVTVHFNFPNAIVADKAAVNDLAEKIYPRLKKLEAWGH